MILLGKHSYSIESIYHFRCCSCYKWWSIGDWTPIWIMYCPHCGQAAEPVKMDSPTDPLASMTDEQRLDYFYKLKEKYCDGCGREQPKDWGRCQCQNDE